MKKGYKEAMIEGIIILAAIGAIIGKITSDNKWRKAIRDNGWDNPEYNKYEQKRLFDEYLLYHGHNKIQETFTTWELYQMAQKELRQKGYKWNPEWDIYTPSPNKKEYVKGTSRQCKEIYKITHRKGECASQQHKLTQNFLCPFNFEIYGQNSYEKRYYFFLGLTQYEIYRILVNWFNGNLMNNSCIPEDKIILKKVFENIESWYNRPKNNIDETLKKFTSLYKKELDNFPPKSQYLTLLCIEIVENSTLYETSLTFVNDFGEKRVWYDDLMAFEPRKDFIVFPSEKQMRNMDMVQHKDDLDAMWFLTMQKSRHPEYECK